MKSGKFNINAEGSFAPMASASTLEIPLQIARIANQNNATANDQNAQIVFHRFFLTIPNIYLPPVVLNGVLLYYTEFFLYLQHFPKTKQQFAGGSLSCAKKSGHLRYPLFLYSLYSPTALLVSMVWIIFSMEGLPMWVSFSPMIITRF